MNGLYLHIPFCRQKCPYCDFFSLPAKREILEGYADQLKLHLVWAVDHGWSGPVDTIYFGGGTPSLLPPKVIADLLRTIDQKLGISSGAEITLEVNPGTVSRVSLGNYLIAGINRLSIGLQSLSSRQLTRLGRSHTTQEGQNAVKWARSAGFSNLSVDLMFGLPGQSLSDLDKEIDNFLNLETDHLSCYGLSAEDTTPYGRLVSAGQLQLPDDELYAAAYMLINKRLTMAGYRHYEIANYAREGHLCQHNLGYWQRRSYLGLGAGAHTFDSRRGGKRWAVPNDVEAYFKALAERREPAVCLESFTQQQALSETLYLRLRTDEGISDLELQNLFATDLTSAFPKAASNLSPWLNKKGDRWSFSLSGWLLYDRLIQAFL